MLPSPQKNAFFALTGGICKVNNFSPAETYLFVRGFSSVMSVFGTFKFYSRAEKCGCVLLACLLWKFLSFMAETSPVICRLYSVLSVFGRF